MPNDLRRQLRRQLRARRKALTPRQQREASHQLLQQLAQHPAYRRSRRIACYLANDGELDLTPVIQHARRHGKQLYLPVLHRWPRSGMAFQRLHRQQTWTRNRFGIREPQPQRKRQCKPWTLNLILMPLVGFDPHGARLGMGGGFYDRHLAILQRRAQHKATLLVGVAHECQKVERLESAYWDIPMQATVTDKAWYWPTRA